MNETTDTGNPEQRIEVVELYESADKVYQRRITGRFQRLRRNIAWPLFAGFLLLPWINWGDRQSVLFDLVERKFHILGLTLWPQDLVLLSAVLIISAFLLFTVTVAVGRAWCGYSCPQTIWTQLFVWAELFAEGDRNQRIQLDQRSWSLEKLRKKSLKHGLWLTISAVTAITFVGYFTPVRQLIIDLSQWQANGWAVFWIGFFAFATYGNAGWMREQVCKYMCPYARFQSAMFDSETLIISYDQERGEPRGARKKGVKDDSKGDCIDCYMCVQVCPVDIDIRDGLQYECISCGLCIDACDQVMDRMGYEPGLVRYTTEKELEGQPWRFWRPKLVGYSIMSMVIVVGFILLLVGRSLMELDIIRDRNQLYRELSNGGVENTYLLKIMNKDQQPHDYRITLESAQGLRLSTDQVIPVGAGEVFDLPVRAVFDPAETSAQTESIRFCLTELETQAALCEESRFIAPVGGR